MGISAIKSQAGVSRDRLCVCIVRLVVKESIGDPDLHLILADQIGCPGVLRNLRMTPVVIYVYQVFTNVRSPEWDVSVKLCAIKV